MQVEKLTEQVTARFTKEQYEALCACLRMNQDLWVVPAHYVRSCVIRDLRRRGLLE